MTSLCLHPTLLSRGLLYSAITIFPPRYDTQWLTFLPLKVSFTQDYHLILTSFNPWSVPLA